MDRRIGPGALVEDFLYQYESSTLGRGLKPAERLVAEEVLFDFLTSDLDIEAPTICDGVLVMIRGVADQLLGQFEQHGSVLKIGADMIEHSARRYEASLRLRERSFKVMRQHLVMMSDRRS